MKEKTARRALDAGKNNYENLHALWLFKVNATLPDGKKGKVYAAAPLIIRWKPRNRKCAIYSFQCPGQIQHFGKLCKLPFGTLAATDQRTIDFIKQCASFQCDPGHEEEASIFLLQFGVQLQRKAARHGD